MVTQPVRGEVTGELSRLVATADYERLRSSLQSAFEEADVFSGMRVYVYIIFLNFQILLRSLSTEKPLRWSLIAYLE